MAEAAIIDMTMSGLTVDRHLLGARANVLLTLQSDSVPACDDP
jgi:hypothetical protein